MLKVSYYVIDRWWVAGTRDLGGWSACLKFVISEQKRRR